MDDSQIFQKIILFFYLSSLEEKFSIEIASRAVELFKLKKSNYLSKKIDLEILMVEICNALYEEHQNKFTSKQITIINSTIISWPDHLDLTPWCEFQKRSSNNEKLTVLWVNVLNVTTEKLSKALNISEGTIRYRLGKGLSLLGQLNRPNWGAL